MPTPIPYPNLTSPSTRVMATSSTGLAYAISGGQYTQTGPSTVNTGTVEIGSAQSADIEFFGNANNATFDCRIWAKIPHANTTGNTLDFKLRYLGVANVVCGSITGSTNGAVSATEYIADTIVWTPSSAATSPTGPGTTSAAAKGLSSGAAHSPADNTPAILYLTNLDGATGLVFDFLVVTATAANAMCMAGRV